MMILQYGVVRIGVSPLAHLIVVITFGSRMEKST